MTITTHQHSFQTPQRQRRVNSERYKYWSHRTLSSWRKIKFPQECISSHWGQFPCWCGKGQTMNNVGFCRAHCLRDPLFRIPLFESNFLKYKDYTSLACHRRQWSNWKGKVRGEETVQGKVWSGDSKKPDGHRLSHLHCKVGDVLPLSWIQTCFSEAKTRQFLLSLTMLQTEGSK